MKFLRVMKNRCRGCDSASIVVGTRPPRRLAFEVSTPAEFPDPNNSTNTNYLKTCPNEK